MTYNLRSYAQGQMYLMPLSITEWVSEASLARFTSEVLDEMDRDGQMVAFYRGCLSTRRTRPCRPRSPRSRPEGSRRRGRKLRLPEEQAWMDSGLQRTGHGGL